MEPRPVGGDRPAATSTAFVALRGLSEAASTFQSADCPAAEGVYVRCSELGQCASQATWALSVSVRVTSGYVGHLSRLPASGQAGRRDVRCWWNLQLFVGILFDIHMYCRQPSIVITDMFHASGHTKFSEAESL